MAGVGIELSPGAFIDLKEAVDFLWGRSPRIAQKFGEDYYNSVLMLRDYPRIGSEIGRGERHLRIRRGPYWLVYRESDGNLVILAIAHASREPGYWRDRL